MTKKLTEKSMVSRFSENKMPLRCTRVYIVSLVPFLPRKDVYLQQNPLNMKFPRRLQFHTYVTAAEHSISEENPIFNLKWKRAGSSREEKNLFWSPAPHGRTMMRGKRGGNKLFRARRKRSHPITSLHPIAAP